VAAECAAREQVGGRHTEQQRQREGERAGEKREPQRVQHERRAEARENLAVAGGTEG
jgi:hypothetical protein